MSVIVAEGKVVVEADATDVPRRIARDIEDGSGPAERAGKSLGGSVFKGVLGAWAAIGGATAITGWFTGGVSGASDLNETLSKSGVVFGDSAAAIESFGDAADRNLGLSKNAAIGAAASFGDMFTQLGYTQDAAAAMSQQVLIAAADLGSFSNLETADVADRMAAAFRGEYDSLQQVIPNINAARVESEALAATGKTVASELTAQEKAAAVLAIVQKDGAKATGDFARTSDQAANRAKIVTAELENQQAKLGGVLLPAWTGFLGFLSDTAIPMFSDVVDWVGKNTDTLLILGGVVATAVGSYYAITGAMALYKAFQIASAAATGGLTVAQWGLNAAMSANPIGLIITLIALLVGAIVWVATQTTFFQDAWAAVTSFIGTAWQWLWDSVLNPVFTAIGAVFTWLYNNIIMPIITGIMVYIGIWAAIFTWLYQSIVQPIFNAIGAIFTWLYNSVILPVVGFIRVAIQSAGLIFTWLYQNAIKPAFDGVAAAFKWVKDTVISPVVDFIKSAIRGVGDTVSSVFGGIAGFVESAFKSALSVMRGPINGIIGLVNGAINGLNSLSVTIPDWVPLVGGQTWGLSLPTIPMLARGSNNAPDAFIAGEQGPELITGAKGATVRPYSATRDMLARGGLGGQTVVNLKQDIYATDPILGARQAAREVVRYLGV